MVRLHDGSALIEDSKRGTPLPPGTGPKYDQLTGYGSVLYGEVQPHQLNAILGLDCSNDDTTEYLYTVAVFSGESGQLKVVGLLKARIQPSGGQPTSLDPIPVADGTLAVEEAYTDKGNDSSFPSGIALTTWTYRAGRLVPTRTTSLTYPPFGRQSVSQGESDLTKVDWNNVAVPGNACDHAGPIQLRGGNAELLDPKRGTPIDAARTGPGYDNVNDSWTPVIYGQVIPGQWDAVVSLSCNNGGGTADGALLYSLAVYTGHPGDLTEVGLVTPQIQQADELPTLLTPVPVKPGLLAVREAYYNSGDGTCCPSGQALTTWTFANGHLAPSRTVIIPHSRTTT